VEKKEVLPKNIEADVRSRDRTCGLDPRRTVQSVTGNFIFTSHPIALVSLF
jgi:hypothetical protein